MTPLAPLPFPTQSEHPIFAVHGHGTQLASVALRMLKATNELKSTPMDALTIACNHFDGIVKTRPIPNGPTLFSAAFKDKTCILGEIVDTVANIYPQPVMNASGVDISVCLRDSSGAELKGFVQALCTTHNVSNLHPAEATGTQAHFISWQTYRNRMPNDVNARLSLFSQSLAVVLGMPKKLPPNQSPFRFRGLPNAQPPLPSFSYRIFGRMLNADGSVTKPTVQLEPKMVELNPEWSEQAQNCLSRLAQHPDVCPNPYEQVAQRVTSIFENNKQMTKVEPEEIFSQKVSVDTSLSRHKILQLAAKLPLGVV